MCLPTVLKKLSALEACIIAVDSAANRCSSKSVRSFVSEMVGALASIV